MSAEDVDLDRHQVETAIGFSRIRRGKRALANLRSICLLRVINQLQLAFNKDKADRIFREIWDVSLASSQLETLLEKPTAGSSATS